jgi:hypothetical protein
MIENYDKSSQETQENPGTITASKTMKKFPRKASRKLSNGLRKTRKSRNRKTHKFRLIRSRCDLLLQLGIKYRTENQKNFLHFIVQ